MMRFYNNSTQFRGLPARIAQLNADVTVRGALPVLAGHVQQIGNGCCHISAAHECLAH